jgi:hypothetical protein
VTMTSRSVFRLVAGEPARRRFKGDIFRPKTGAKLGPLPLRAPSGTTASPMSPARFYGVVPTHMRTAGGQLVYRWVDEPAPSAGPVWPR